MSTELYQSLILELANDLQIPEMKPDDGGYLCLQVDDAHVVHIQHEPESDEIIFFTQLGEVDPQYETATYRMLLEGNLMGLGTKGATLALSPGEGLVTLSRFIPDGVAYEDFRSRLEAFVDMADEWKNRLENVATTLESETERLARRLPDDDEGSRAEPESSEESPGDDGSGIRV